MLMPHSINEALVALEGVKNCGGYCGVGPSDPKSPFEDLRFSMLGCAWPRGKSNATGNWLSALLPFVGGRARRREKLAHRQLWSWRGPQPKKSPGEGQRHWRHPTLADVTVRSIRRSFLGFPSVVVLPLLAVVPLLALPLVAPISLTVVLLPSVLTALSAAGFLPAAGSHLPPHNLPRQISRPERRRKL